MSHPEITPEAYCNFLGVLSSKERHERLKALQANDLFCAVMPLLPEQLRDEFWWLEKRECVQWNLKHQVVDGELEKLMKRDTEGQWPTSLKVLVDQKSNDDELWLFEEFPGDMGYGLVRECFVVNFSILQVTTITTD